MVPASWLRMLGLAVGFLVAFSIVPWAVYRAMERAEVEEPYTHLGPADYMRNNIEHLRPDPDAPFESFRVALFGDSVMASFPKSHSMEEVLQREMWQRSGGKLPVRVSRLALPGMGPFDYYFFADDIVDAQPDAIVYAVNLASFGDPWRRRFVRPELAGWVRGRRLGDAVRLPLEWIGLTFDRFGLYLGLKRMLPFDVWYFIHRQQARVGRARQDLSKWIGKRFGSGAETDYESARLVAFVGRGEIPQRKRFTRDGLRQHYGPALSGIGPDHPVVQMLAASLKIFHEAGVPTLVFITPVNVEFIESEYPFDAVGLARTIRSIGTVAQRNGADFVDLHRLLPDEGFRDAPGHLAYEGDLDARKVLGRALAPRAIETLLGPKQND